MVLSGSIKTESVHLPSPGGATAPNTKDLLALTSARGTRLERIRPGWDAYQ